MATEPATIHAGLSKSAVSLAPVHMSAAGVLATAYGVLLALVTQAQWAGLTPPGTVIGPESFVQSLVLRIDQGIYLCILGSVLALGGWLLFRRESRSMNRGPTPFSPPRWRAPLLAVPVLLVLVVFVIGILPIPYRTLSLPPADFALAPAGVTGSGETLVVSNPFPADAGEYFDSISTVVFRNRLSGATVFMDNMSFRYVKGVSDPYGLPQFGSGHVAASAGSYVLVVRPFDCEYFTSQACANYTVDATGTVWIHSPTVYLPTQYALGAAACAVVVGVVVQSGLGSRRMTS